MICSCGLNHYIDGSESAPPRVLDGDKPNPAYKVWVDQLVLSWIVTSISESILPQLIGAETSRAAWDKLIAAYSSGSKPLIRELKAQLHNLRRDNATIESYAQGAKAIADKLAILQYPITNDDLVEFVLAGLGSAYRPFHKHSTDKVHYLHIVDEVGGILIGVVDALLAMEAYNNLKDDATVPATSTNVAPLTIQIPSSIPQSVVLIPSSLNSSSPSPATPNTTLLNNSTSISKSQCSKQCVVAAPQSPLQSHVMPTDASSLSPEIPSNTLPTVNY
ncbi:hypothetical protein H5410_052614 [Solanum commersonii]|uniref:Uncharacterized protein n=1 Tax=Solanum commersonii TaxID=4109 RepID=A0A9J5X1K2_SOLCO|nr:hypothetical protein H5410_052614 [Solanum commersonii]